MHFDYIAVYTNWTEWQNGCEVCKRAKFFDNCDPYCTGQVSIKTRYCEADGDSFETAMHLNVSKCAHLGATIFDILSTYNQGLL